MSRTDREPQFGEPMLCPVCNWTVPARESGLCDRCEASVACDLDELAGFLRRQEARAA